MATEINKGMIRLLTNEVKCVLPVEINKRAGTSLSLMLKCVLLLLLLGPVPAFSQTRLVVLGTVQDAGYPHIGCEKECCENQWNSTAPRRLVSCVGVTEAGQSWLFDATPDMPAQIKALLTAAGNPARRLPEGIFLTHAHIGHYTGLMYLGREAAGANKTPVYTMPRLKTFLESNGPWEQLVKLDNIALREMQEEKPVTLTPTLQVSPIRVPHRDEYSETVGFIIQGPTKKALFLPDIDKWNRWNKKLEDILARVDYALVDATFFKNGEIPGRDMSEIPHPFVEETMALLQNLPPAEKTKVYFIHLNHTNPLLNPASPAYREVLQAGFHVAEEGMVLEL